MTKKIRTLDLLKNGEKARIKSINAEGKLLHKLLDMGFINHVEIEVVREAPLFDPVELRLHNYLLSIRKHEAKLIEIEDIENE